MTFETSNRPLDAGPEPARRFYVPSRLVGAGIVVAVLAIGATGGAAAYRYVSQSQPQRVLLLQPTAIAHMTGSGPVAVKGQVAEIFGNKFVLQDRSGRTLVDTGPRGEDGKPVAKGEMVTIQGGFDNGFIHADLMTRADGTTEAFGPPRPPHREPRPDDRRGPPADGPPHPDGGPDRGPPPPPAPQ